MPGPSALGCRTIFRMTTRRSSRLALRHIGARGLVLLRATAPIYLHEGRGLAGTRARRRTLRASAAARRIDAAVDQGIATFACGIEHAHCSQAVGHLLGEPSLECGCLGELGGVE